MKAGGYVEEADGAGSQVYFGKRGKKQARQRCVCVNWRAPSSLLGQKDMGQHQARREGVWVRSGARPQGRDRIAGSVELGGYSIRHFSWPAWCHLPLGQSPGTSRGQVQTQPGSCKSGPGRGEGDKPMARERTLRGVYTVGRGGDRSVALALSLSTL